MRIEREHDGLEAAEARVSRCVGEDGRPLVTRNSFRMLQTLYNLGPAPEPNLTVLWTDRLPHGFKEFCARVSIDTSANCDACHKGAADMAEARHVIGTEVAEPGVYPYLASGQRAGSGKEGG